MQQGHQLTDQVRVSKASEENQEPLPQVIGDYKLGRTLGKGTFGKVKEAIHTSTNEKVAIKIIEKKTIQDQDDKNRILRQVQIMKTARHPNIIHIYEIIQTDSRIFLVLQYAQQGQLFKLMNNQGRLKQRAAGRIFIQIMNAVEYLHRLDIVHRDLKPQNILLDVDFNIKLIDYGLSNYHQEGEKLSTACGSPCYAPPQMLLGNDYDGKIGDVWSMGIIFYGMLCGQLPFQEQNTKDLYKRVIQGFYYIPNDISIESIQVIQKMLVTDPQKRITIPQIRKLPFFQQIKKIQPQIIGIFVGLHPMPIDDQILDRMKLVSTVSKNQIQCMIKQNQHNELTTIYYLIQKQVLRQGGKTVVDLQIFLETHQKYKQQYGKRSFSQYQKQKEVKTQEKNRQSNYTVITPSKFNLNTERKPAQKSKIQRKGLSKQNYNKNDFKGNHPLNFFSNQRINRKFISSLDANNLRKLTSKANIQVKTKQRLNFNSLSKAKNQKSEILNTVQTARSNLGDKMDKLQTQKKERSKSKSLSKPKKLKLKSPGKNLTVNLWNAYFQEPLQKKAQKYKEKKRKINPKQQQRILNFDMNVKKLKQGFLQLPHMGKTKKLNLKKQQLTQKSALETTRKFQNYHTTTPGA